MLDALVPKLAAAVDGDPTTAVPDQDIGPGVDAGAPAAGDLDDGMGGITMDVSAVVVEGDTATVTYDVLFGGNPAYSDLTGTLVRAGDTWTVTRDEFCSFMASARTPCP